MAAYVYEVIRWPFQYTATNMILTKIGGGGGSTTITVATGIYVMDGNNGVQPPPVNFLPLLEAAINTGIITLGGGSVIDINMDIDGKAVFRTTVSDSNKYDLKPGVGGAALIGADLVGGEVRAAESSIQNVTMARQCSHQWHPGIDADYDSGGLQRIIVDEGRNLKGDPRRIRRDFAPWTERVLDWSRIASARMAAARAATLAFAEVAGFTTATEVNTWEAMWLYLCGAVGPYGDNRVYLYSTNDPTTTSRSGPYHYILGDSTPGLRGLPAGGYERGLSSEYYAVKILLKAV